MACVDIIRNDYNDFLGKLSEIDIIDNTNVSEIKAISVKKNKLIPLLNTNLDKLITIIQSNAELVDPVKITECEYYEEENVTFINTNYGKIITYGKEINDQHYLFESCLVPVKNYYCGENYLKFKLTNSYTIDFVDCKINQHTLFLTKDSYESTLDLDDVDFIYNNFYKTTTNYFIELFFSLRAYGIRNCDIVFEMLFIDLSLIT